MPALRIQSLRRTAGIGLLVLLAAAAGCGDDNGNGGGGQPFTVTNLASDQAGKAPVTDAHLHNAWGIARTANGPWWVANAGSGTSTVYDGNGTPFPTASPLVVTIPAPGEDEAAPTGTVANGTADFVITSGGTSGPAIFLFATENGTIVGWNLNSGATAQIVVDNSGDGAIYKGLALGTEGNANRLYGTNFHQGTVDVFDGGFNPVVHDGAFNDPNIPDGYAPFGIQNIGGSLFVTYAKQDGDKKDDVAGAGNGYVDVYSGAGTLLRRFASRGHLNAPWGIAPAPASFGPFDNAVLVGNFGDGRINAFNVTTGDFEGQLQVMGGHALEIDGLWGLAFGNGATAGSANTLYFAAGPNDEADGLFGMITPAS